MLNQSYDDILNLPHPKLTKYPQIPIAKRAAQFAAFAALSGYEAAIIETGRRTDKRLELSEDAIAILDRKLATLADSLAEHPEVTVTYFQEDERKEGGVYISRAGRVKKIDDNEKDIVFMDGIRISIKDILMIECELFGEEQ